MESSVEINDAIGALFLIYSRFIGDNAEINDSIQIEKLAYRLLESNIDLTDLLIRSISAGPEALERILQSAITIYNLETEVNTNQTNQITESISIEDLIIRILDVERILVNTLDINDNLERIARYNRQLQSLLSVNDSIISIIQGKIIEISLASSLNLNDALSTEYILNRALLESLATVDVIVREFKLERLLHSDIDLVIDIIISSGIFHIDRVLRDELGISDTISREFTGQILRAILYDIVELDIQVGIEELNIIVGATEV